MDQFCLCDAPGREHRESRDDARELRHDNALIEFNACYASVTRRFEEAKVRLRHAFELDKEIRALALDDVDLKPLWN